MPGPVKLGEIADRLGARAIGGADLLIEQVGSLEHAGPRQIALYSGPRYRAQLAATRAGAVILSPQAESATQLPRIVADNPHACFARAAQLLNPSAPPSPGVHASAHVHAAARVAPSACVEAGAIVSAGAVVGERAWIGAGSYVGEGATIGADSRLHAHVAVYDGCRLGERVIAHAGAVIGADGFGMANEGGRWVKIPHIGRVLVGDDVEIGANTTIDRGTFDDTVIEEGVKLDNQIQIGHNCRVGAHTAMAGCVGVAGSAVIGRRCMIGGGAIVLGHLSLCDGVIVSAGTLISRSIHQPGTYTGIFPFDENADWLRNAALVRRLAELAARVGALEKARGRDKAGGTKKARGKRKRGHG
ncbi:MAG TPA: UDP-3-O-(3-hydroxymyristoyl)glucosamine N-acyltransferase [Burkholderiales bacterium]|jgi:UDP-3-O-[3-hydroxymyristoyl] glucosamine N-acyltransferase|nr:UDP-3-O-(3-hydroxymyristoyl)glucosamine N-acyltransferase [Burkholderiales bacterium]